MPVYNPVRVLTACTFFIVLFASGCGINDSDPFDDLPYPDFEEEQRTFTDQELTQAVYTDYKYPESFYTEELQGSVVYLTSWALSPADQREWPQLPLCTDSLSVAKDWSEQSSRNSSYYRPLVGERVDEKYFELLRIDPDSTHFLQSRVHRCAFFEPAAPWFFAEADTFGSLNQQPITPERAELLGEYLWFVTHYSTGGYAVLSSFTESEADPSVASHLLYAAETVFGDWNMHDRISLVEHRILTDLSTGTVTYERKRVRTIDGRYHPNPF